MDVDFLFTYCYNSRNCVSKVMNVFIRMLHHLVFFDSPIQAKERLGFSPRSKMEDNLPAWELEFIPPDKDLGQKYHLWFQVRGKPKRKYISWNIPNSRVASNRLLQLKSLMKQPKRHLLGGEIILLVRKRGRV